MPDVVMTDVVKMPEGGAEDPQRAAPGAGRGEDPLPPTPPNLFSKRREFVLEWKGVSLLVVGLVVLCAMAVLVAFVVAPKVAKFVDSQSALWLRDLRHGNGEVRAATMPDIPGVSEEMSARFRAQLEEVQRNARYHLTVSRAFFKYHFVTLSIATTAAVLAGILLVPVSWAGWQGGANVLKVMVILLGGIAALSSAYNRVYNHSRNISTNAALYYLYVQLEDELLSYVPLRLANDTSTADPASMLRDVDARLGKLRNFAIELDMASVPTAVLISQQLSPMVGAPP